METVCVEAPSVGVAVPVASVEIVTAPSVTRGARAFVIAHATDPAQDEAPSGISQPRTVRVLDATADEALGPVALEAAPPQATQARVKGPAMARRWVIG